jgi:hypothetical protein
VSLRRRFLTWILIGSLLGQSVASGSCACTADRSAVRFPDGRTDPKAESGCCHKRQPNAVCGRNQSRTGTPARRERPDGQECPSYTAARCPSRCCRPTGHVACDQGPCTCAGFCGCQERSKPKPAVPVPSQRDETRIAALSLPSVMVTAVVAAPESSGLSAPNSLVTPLSSVERCRTLCRFTI